MIFIAVLKVKPDMVEQFEKAQSELSKLTHEQEPDCYVYDVIKKADDPLSYVCYARFKDQAAFDHHMQIDFHDRLVPPILESLSEEMQLTFYEHIA
ncbi:MAG: antibiotic biosynthesis monooxygenase family protein [Pseudomonadota bacterium]